MDAQQIIDALQNDEKAKTEISAVLDRLIAVYDEEMDGLAKHQADRMQRLEAQRKMIDEDFDYRAALLVKRKDIIREIQMKLKGEKTEPIPIAEIRPFLIEDRRPGKPESGKRGLFGRRQVARIA